MGCQSSQEVAPYKQQAGPQRIEDNAHLINSLVASSDFGGLEKMGDQFFEKGNYLNAIEVYKRAIEAGYKVQFQIQGLGNHDLETYRYEWWTYKWYDGQRKAGKFKGNIFDALSLCYCKIKQSNIPEIDKGIEWYEDMLAQTEGYQLYMGYANILYNRYRYDPALKFYNKVISIRPTLLNAYVSVMFLFEFKRVEKSKSIAFANTILEKDPQNMYAHFVLGKNEKNIDDRIKKLQASAQKFTDYIRLINEVGLSYGAKKDHKSAIQWYKKCLALAPNDYAQGYNNVAFRTEMLQDYQQALNYYYKAVEIDAKYKLAFGNAIKCFKKVNYTDDDIIDKMKQYPKMDEFNFYYYLGLAYYDIPEYEEAINWYKRAQKLNSKSANLYNSLGLVYDSIQQYDLSEQCYQKSMKLDPKYKFPIYNMGLLWKHRGNIDKAIEWYKKAIEVEPEYHPPYNNLGNIYRDMQQYQKAIQLYRKCVEIHSTYTLVYCNMAMCYLKQEMYQDAFSAFARAKELLPTDNNGLSQANKNFLKQNLAKFEIEGQKWRTTGSIGVQQKEKLKQLIKSFESNFKMLYSSESSFKRSDEIVLKPAILEIVNQIHEDKFELKNILKVFELIKHIFHDDEESFHILPQLFIQRFWKSTFIQNRPILEVQNELFSIIKEISAKQAAGIATDNPQSREIKLKNFNPPKDYKVNLFKDTVYFSSYEVLYNEIDKANKTAEKSLPEFIELVDAVRKRSQGIPYGVNMKMPKRVEQQFKVILRILEKMFKKEINEERVKSIIVKIDKKLREGGKNITMVNIVHEIMDVWTNEITLILKEREKSKFPTTCAISDLVRGKIMFDKLEDLEKAVEACDKLCHLKGYNILELDNRLSKPQTQDVVLKIQVNEAVCELQLAMRQDESKYHLIHSIYEIERSPLGCIFGSYLFMSKGFNYPLLANCKDIEARLAKSTEESKKKTAQAAKFIIQALEYK